MWCCTCMCWTASMMVVEPANICTGNATRWTMYYELGTAEQECRLHNTTNLKLQIQTENQRLKVVYTYGAAQCPCSGRTELLSPQVCMLHHTASLWPVCCASGEPHIALDSSIVVSVLIWTAAQNMPCVLLSIFAVRCRFNSRPSYSLLSAEVFQKLFWSYGVEKL